MPSAIAQTRPPHSPGEQETELMRMALVAVAVLVVGLVVVWMGANAPPPSEAVEIPAPTGLLADPSLERTESPPVALGNDHLWPEIPRHQTPVELADNFARHILEWESVHLSDFGHPDDRVWVRIDRASGRELVGVLTAPLPRRWTCHRRGWRAMGSWCRYCPCRDGWHQGRPPDGSECCSR